MMRTSEFIAVKPGMHETNESATNISSFAVVHPHSSSWHQLTAISHRSTATIVYNIANEVSKECGVFAVTSV